MRPVQSPAGAPLRWPWWLRLLRTRRAIPRARHADDRIYLAPF
jgi:hypothetical protein